MVAAGHPFATAVADALVGCVTDGLARRDRFALALTGGKSPRPVYEQLASTPYRDRLDWSRVDFFWGDERSVPPDHAESNFRLAWECLLAALPVPTSQIHRMPAEWEDLDAAARHYEQQIRDTLQPPAGTVPVFDLILLGMGDDGHTASLFPGTAALQEQNRWVVGNDVPQLQTRRLTFTFPLINAAREVWFIVAGAAKAARLAEVLDSHAPVQVARPSKAGLYAPVQYPCQRVVLPGRTVRWYLDEPAASGLPSEDR